MQKWMIAGCLAACMTSAASGVVMVLKQGGDLVAGGALDAAFSGVTAADVAIQDVDDTSLFANPASTYAWTAYGTETLSANITRQLFKFDLSAIPAGATIEKAQLRLSGSGGNTGAGGMSLARVITHDWDEITATRNTYDGAPSPAKNWGPLSNNWFDTADYGTTSTFNTAVNTTIPVSGSCWMVKDVTADVQGFVDGTYTNYGWFVNTGNRAVRTSEFVNADNSTGYTPALFISWTPEPATLALLGLGSLALLRRRVG